MEKRNIILFPINRHPTFTDTHKYKGKYVSLTSLNLEGILFKVTGLKNYNGFALLFYTDSSFFVVSHHIRIIG